MRVEKCTESEKRQLLTQPWYIVSKTSKGESLKGPKIKERAFTESIKTRVQCVNREGVCRMRACVVKKTKE